MRIEQEAVEIVAMARRVPLPETKLAEQHRIRGTRRRVGKLDAKRIADPFAAGTPFALGRGAERLAARGLAGTLRGYGATLVDVASIERTLALQITARKAEAASDNEREARRGACELGLQPRASRRPQRLMLLTTQVDEATVRLGTGTLENRRGGVDRARDRSRGQAARGAKRCLQRRLCAPHKLRIPGTRHARRRAHATGRTDRDSAPPRPIRSCAPSAQPRSR